MYFTIESIHGDIVKLEGCNEGVICLPNLLLPGGAREGDIIDITDGRITLCPEETQARHKSIKALMDELFE
jgi:hypothetical protein